MSEAKEDAKEEAKDDEQKDDDRSEMLANLPADLDLQSGCMDDYEVIKPIGKGKFSVVYRAKRKKDEKLVALKKIAIFDMMDEKARDKTLKEVRLLQSLEHPNIIRYLDAFIDQSELIIIFEWAEAGDLKRQVRKAQEREARFDERVIWKYFVQICEAVRHMHEQRVLHRDLKPANIFLTLAGVVKVGDLGLGRHLSDNTMEAQSKVGTPLYMSPEVLRGNGYDWKSDIWSLGCVLYEMAMLRSPFKSEGLNLYGLFQKISKADHPPLPDVYSQTLRDLVSKMLSVDAGERPDIQEVCRVAREERNRTASAAQGAPAALPAPAVVAAAAVAEDKENPSSENKVEQPSAEEAAEAPAQAEDKNAEAKAALPSAAYSDPAPAHADAKAAVTGPPMVENVQAKGDDDGGGRSGMVMRGGGERERERDQPRSEAKAAAPAAEQQQAAPARTRKAAPSKSGGNSGEVNMYAASEEIFEKLKLLNYDEDDVMSRLNPLYFCMEMSKCVQCASRFEQFSDMVAVAAWLLRKMGRPADFADDDDAPPVQVASALLVATQNSNCLSPAEAAGLRPNALQPGSGAAVCRVLNSICTAAMKHEGLQVRFAAPVYPEEQEEDDQGKDNEDADAGSEIEDNIEDEFDDEPLFEQSKIVSSNAQEEQDKLESSEREMIESKTSERQWNMEVERVTPRLKVSGNSGYSSDWGARLTQMKSHQNMYVKHNIGRNTSTDDDDKKSKSEADGGLVGHLHSISKMAKDEMSRITRHEDRVNITLSDLKEEYTAIFKEHATLEASFTDQQQSVTDKSNSLSQMTGRLEAIKEQLDQKGENMADASPLVVIRHALTQLKSEMAKMDIAIGIVQNSLVNAQLSQGTRAAKTAAKSKMRGEDFDDDEDFADDSDDSDWTPTPQKGGKYDGRGGRDNGKRGNNTSNKNRGYDDGK